MKKIDCRSMTCPLPVVTVKRALEEADGEKLQIFLDGGAPRENVSRYLRSRGLLFSEVHSGNGVEIVVSGAEEVPSPAAVPSASVILAASDRLGDGVEELGRLLMRNFLITLLDAERLPAKILFINSGVFLTTEGSEVLEALEKLEQCGVEILSCGACLDFYHRKDKLRSGSVTNMFAIVDALLSAPSVIRL